NPEAVAGGVPADRLAVVPVVTLLTDFGSNDHYVAVLKGVVLARAPGALPIDLVHEVAAGDVEGACWLLAASWPWFAPGTVHLAVVDPGVGSERRILAVTAGDHHFVAPDNGLLTAILDLPGAVARAVERQDLFLAGPGATFHGRDRFAPLAAYLAAGGDAAALGPLVDDAVRLPIPPPRVEGAAPRPDAAGAVLHGRVAHVDRFGNLVTDIPVSWLGSGPCRAEIGRQATARRAGHYAEIPEGEVAMLPGSNGTLELSLPGESLARRWGVERGATVRVVVVPAPED
ncbi:MAG TPA: SAM-dependent chlorinase/fluorinase, partial [Thermoanaerobaculia bacterium]|nr:SAM-dependent chlorinase/fluorinase [Thermoanaerobaculia bacterium]